MGQQGFAAIAVDQAAPVGVQRPVGKLLDLLARSGSRCGLGLGMANPAHQVLGPRDQLARVQRFDHVVISTAFQADDAVDLVVAPGNQDDAHFRTHPQFTGQGQAVLAGQADIEHHQVDRRTRQMRFGKFRRGRTMHVVAFLGQVGLQQFANQRIVIDDQYPRSHCMVSCNCRPHQVRGMFFIRVASAGRGRPRRQSSHC
ncbi:hypothetical protein D9M71_286940 [compost metagenome]